MNIYESRVFKSQNTKIMSKKQIRTQGVTKDSTEVIRKNLRPS